MEKRTEHIGKPSGSPKPEIIRAQEGVKASLLSSNPMNGSQADTHFEDEVLKAFFRVFFNINSSQF